MQDNGSRSLKKDTRGVIGLPIKILVIMIVLAVAVPVVINAAENGEKSMKETEMNMEISKITDAVSVVYYSGIDSQRTVNVNIPAGCEISLGGEGEDAFSIRSIYNGEIISTKYFDKPQIAIENNLFLSGSVSLCVKCVGAGVFGSVEITVI